MSRRSPKRRPSSVKATTVIETTCRCGLSVSVGTANGQPAAFHAQPQCKDFVERDLSPYLRWLAEGVKATEDVEKIVQFTKILDKFTSEHLARGAGSERGLRVGTEIETRRSPVFLTACACGIEVTLGIGIYGPSVSHAVPHCNDYQSRRGQAQFMDYIEWLAETKPTKALTEWIQAATRKAKAGDWSKPQTTFLPVGSTDDGMIPGLFASLTLACDVCGEEATYVEGSRKDDCTCMEPQGTHIMRRCPTGHENQSHIAGGEIEGSFENQAGSDEAILRTRMDRKTASMLDRVADERGVTRDDVVRESLDHALGQEKCLRCQHRNKRHDWRGAGKCEVPGCGCESYLGSVKGAAENIVNSEAGRWLSKAILGPKARKIIVKIMRLVGPSVPTEEISRAVLARVTLFLHCGTCDHAIMLHKVEESEDGPCGEDGCDCKVCVFDAEQADTAMTQIEPEDVARKLREGSELAQTIAARPWVAGTIVLLESAPTGCRELFVRAMAAIQTREPGKRLLGEMTFDEMRRELGQRSVFESCLFWEAGFIKAVGLFRESLRLEQIDHRDFDKVLSSKVLGSFLQGSEADLVALRAKQLDRTPGVSLTVRPHHYLSTQLISAMRLLWADKREFRLSPGIAESLLLTEVKGINVSELKLPYESFLIRFPAGLIDLAAEDGNVYPMVSAIVSEWDVSEGFWKDGAKARGVGPKKRAITIFGMGAWNKQSADAGDTTSLGWLACLDDNEVATLGLWSVEGGSADALPNERAFTVNQQAVKLATRLVLNTCLYVSLPNSDVVLDGQETLNRLRERVRKHPKGSHKGERAREELRGEEKKPQVRKVGWSIRVPASVREAASHERTARGRHFTAQWLVRGHWRNQAVGDRVEGKHKLKWIQPYYCRRDLGERLKPAPYRVS